MKIIVGLGNPGDRYRRTRHNIGFMVIDKLALKLKIDLFEPKWQGMVGMRSIKGEEIYLVKPNTYMNLSGKCVRLVVDDTGIGFKDILVILDDIELPLGTIRIRVGGSSGGHNGLQSIIEECGTENIPRLRIGIGKPTSGIDLADYVLSDFTLEELTVVDKIVEMASDAVICWVFEGIENAMSKFNRNYLLGIKENSNDKEEEK